jgi:8-oxo-dGTP diphosphatase
MIVVTAAVIERDDTFLLTRRLEGTHLAGTWEFPGGKCEGVETPQACLRRELREELDVEASVGEELFRTRYHYPDRVLDLRFFRCSISGEPRAVQGQEMRWVPRGDMRSLSVPPADAAFIERLCAPR